MLLGSWVGFFFKGFICIHRVYVYSTLLVFFVLASIFTNPAVNGLRTNIIHWLVMMFFSFFFSLSLSFVYFLIDIIGVGMGTN